MPTSSLMRSGVFALSMICGRARLECAIVAIVGRSRVPKGPVNACRAQSHRGDGGRGKWHLVSLPSVTGKATAALELSRVPGASTVYAAGMLSFGGYPSTNALVLRYGR